MAGFALHSKVLGRLVRPFNLCPAISRLTRLPAHQHQTVRAAAPATLNYPTQQQQQQGFAQPQGVQGFYDNPGPAGGASRVFANFSIYKGKSAAQVQVLSPTFKATASGNYYVERPGSVFIEFADAVQGTGSAPGERRYDWANKQIFALSAVEFAGLVEPAPQNYLHDPQRGSTGQGQTIKNLKFNPAGDSGDWFLSVEVKKDGANSRISIPVSKNELLALKTLSVTVIPHLLGLDEVMNRGINLSSEDQTQSPF